MKIVFKFKNNFGYFTRLINKSNSTKAINQFNLFKKLLYVIIIVIKSKKPTNNNGFIFLWCYQESNRGHKDFQSFALPTEL